MTLISEASPISVRDLESEQASKLVMTPSIVVVAHCIKGRNTGIEGYDHGDSFSENLSESQGDGHELVTTVYKGDIGTGVQYAEEASPYTYVGGAAQTTDTLHRAAGLGHGHPTRARPPEPSTLGRINATDTNKTRDKTNAPNMRRRRPNQASRCAKANRINWGETEYQGPNEEHEVHIRQVTSREST